MAVNSGDYSIGPANGKLTINTFVGGMGAKMGHDLVLEAKDWDGTAHIDAADPAASSVQVTVKSGSLEVVGATGGLKPLTDKDKEDIAVNLKKTLQTRQAPQITFRSTAVTGNPPKTSVEGDLTIVGRTRPVTLELTVDDTPEGTQITGQTRFQQTDFGIKPYSKLGALKVKDEVEMHLDLTLSGS
jgi:polyisoprenoid-binding protein YceI